MLQFQRYDQGRIFCDLVKVSLSHKKSEINDISKILACLSMQQFAILSWQLAKIISCKDISSKNYYFNIGKQLWIVISDNVWQYMKHVVLFVVFATWNFGVFKTYCKILHFYGFPWDFYHFRDMYSEDMKIEIDLNIK